MKVLSTKVLNSKQKQSIVSFGYAYSEWNFIQIEKKEFNYEGDTSENLIFTSQNAVRQVFSNPKTAALLKNRNCFCVGEKTKSLLEENGQKIIYTAHNSIGLANFITEFESKSTFLFFCGEERVKDIETVLSKNNIALKIIEIYKTLPKTKKVGSFDGILFFSPSAVKSFLKSNDIGQSCCICIGETTAKELEGFTNNISIASKPSVENTIYALVQNLQLVK